MRYVATLSMGADGGNPATSTLPLARDARGQHRLASGQADPWRRGRTTSMDFTRRRELARRLLDGYVHGPAAATEATARALTKAAAAESILVVEGISDQIAIETLAARLGRDLDADRVVVLPTGGAHAMT